MGGRITIDHKGETFFWSEDRGVVAANAQPIPNATRQALQRKIDKALASGAHETCNPIVLLTRASAAKKQGQLTRAERLARRVLEQDDRDEAAVSFLSSILRMRNKSRAAVRLTNSFDDTRSVILLTTRAAALIDVGDLDEAKQVAERALRIACEAGQPDGELRAVVERLERELEKQ